MRIFYRTGPVLNGLAIGLLTLAVLLVAPGTTVASYPDYDDRTGTMSGGCKTCHGDFRAGGYVSWSDGQMWNNDLMGGHNGFLSNECFACHTGGFNNLPVFLGSSDGGAGLDPIGCLGCHGRDEGGTVTGAGLRQHHWVNGVTTCGNAGCHPTDSDPALFTTVGEDVLPPYYGTAGYNDMPDHPCNLQGYNYSEDVLGEAGIGGLDNDGDNTYDTADTDCAGIVSTELTTWGRIKALYE